MRGSTTATVWVLLAALAIPAGAAWAGAAAPVREGGFRLFDPEDRERNDAALLSLGPLVLGGVRHRNHVPIAAHINYCYEMNFALLGSKSTKRAENSIAVDQKNHVIVFFVVYECSPEGNEECVVQASQPVDSACSGSIAVNAETGVTGKVRLQCKDGIDVTNPAFQLASPVQFLLQGALPNLANGFSVSYKDDAGEEVSGKELDAKIQNFDVDALDDPVGTFLADDGLPGCT